MKSIALYARVSTEHQEKQSTIASQIAGLKERAQRDGHVVLAGDVYADDGYSGSTLVRPALERLRDRAAEGGLDVLYVLSPDRLARRYAYQVLLIEELTRYGVQVVFVTGPQGRGPEEELLVQVQGMIAEYERARILERSRRGKLHKARTGQVNPLSCAPYGYQYVCKAEGEPARYQPLLHEAKVVRSVFQWLVEEQSSLRSIAKRLMAEGIPTRTGKAVWRPSAVSKMMRNPAYMGLAGFGKTEPAPPTKLLKPPRGRNGMPRNEKSSSRRKPESEWVRIPVPALVAVETFAAAQEQLERNRQLAARNARSDRYLLRGLVRCAKCGYGYYGRTNGRRRQRDGQQLGYYYCFGSDRRSFGGQPVCTNRPVRVDHLDRYVWESVVEVVRDPERVAAEWARRGAEGGTVAELRRERDELARVQAGQEQTLRRLQDAYEAGAFEVGELTERTRRVRERLRRGREELEQAEARLKQTVEVHALASKLSDFADQVRSGLNGLDWSGRQQLVRMLVSRIEVDDDAATIVYRLPGGGRGMDRAELSSTTGTRSDVCDCVHGAKTPKERSNGNRGGGTRAASLASNSTGVITRCVRSGPGGWRTR
jgi:site-specific DNA recombinase